MKLLLLCHKPPIPAKDGGSYAIRNLAEAMISLGHSIDILTITTPKHGIPDKELHFYQNYASFHKVFVNTKISIFHAILNLIFSNKPYNVLRFRSEEFRRKLTDLLKLKKYDIIQIESAYMMIYADIVRENSDAIIALRTHNTEFQIWQHLSDSAVNFIEKYYYRLLSKRMRTFEAHIIDKYNLLITLTEHDLKQYTFLGNNKPAIVCPFGYNLDSQYSSAIKAGNNKSKHIKTLYFLGSLDYRPNYEGLIWFISKVYPRLHLSRPSIEFHIAGRNPSSELKKILDHPGITFHGEVSDSTTFVKMHDILIVPCFSGSGMRIKIIEAMACGKPVITTTMGAAGIKAEDGKSILLADTADEFLQHIEILTDNAELYNSVSMQAQQLVQGNYSNSKIAASLSDFYKTQLK